jgi:excisionase family DNA binding protein
MPTIEAVPRRSPTTLATAANPPPLLKVADAAERLNISRSMAYRLVSDGTLPTIRYRRMLRVDPAALEEWISGHAV